MRTIEAWRIVYFCTGCLRKRVTAHALGLRRELLQLLLLRVPLLVRLQLYMFLALRLVLGQRKCELKRLGRLARRQAGRLLPLHHLSLFLQLVDLRYHR